ncbi:hypothetical protein CDAR_261211 [Caerostris darwini]|uniref:Uncharacterized protein n=1 Tax=Caerostris darwini TaxID=1538125 RepID=A0AAV4WCQ4_9ARAC|nr:hypothetical protein CDAR_261211 [Caerostris darwini]
MLEETEPKPTENVMSPTQVFDAIRKSTLEMAIQSRRALDQLEKRLSQLDPSSEDAAKLKGSLTFYSDNYKSNLKVILEDTTVYPSSSEELQAILNAKDKDTNSPTDETSIQTPPTSEEVSTDTSDELQTESPPISRNPTKYHQNDSPAETKLKIPKSKDLRSETSTPHYLIWTLKIAKLCANRRSISRPFHHPQ